MGGCPMRVVWAAVFLAVGVVLAGCGAGSAPGVGPSSVSGSVAVAPPPTAGASRGSASTPPVKSGHTGSAPVPKRVTLGDAGRTFRMRPGQRFLLALGGPPPNWSVRVSDTSVLRRVPNVMVVRGAQGIYQARKAGTAVLTAVSHYACESAHPACLPADRVLRVTIRVAAPG